MKIFHLLLILILTSCVGPDREPNYMEIAPTWHNTDSKLIRSNHFEHYEWWKGFNDDVLNHLVQLAVKNNFDLKLAEARIKKARASQAQAEAKYLPSLDITSTASVEKLNLPKTFSNSQGTQKSTINGLNASWDIDLFGENSSLAESQRQDFLSAVASKNHLLAVLITDLATNYITYRKYQNLIAINERDSKSRKDIYPINLKVPILESGNYH